MKKHIKIVIVQALFLIGIFILIYFLYPRANLEVSGNSVIFDSINAKVIVISVNPDFSNPRYIEFGVGKKVSFELSPGTYYWKADNGIIEGLKNEFVVESEVGLMVNRTDNESELVNIGNVKVNVTMSDEGMMIGHIILEPDEKEKIEDKKEEYVGRQDE